MLSTVVEHLHERAPLVETVLVALTADPAVAEPVPEDFEVRPRHPAGVNRLSRLCAQRIDHERDLVVQHAGAPLRRAQQLGQERVRLGRVEAYQRQQRPRERRVVRKHVTSAGTDLVRNKAGVDQAPRGEIVTAEHGDHGARGEPTGRCRLAFASRPRQSLEQVLGGPEPSFQNLDESDVGRMSRRGRRQAPAGVDHRLSRARCIDHVAQTTGQGAVDVTRRQQGQEVDRQWLSEETPVIRVRIPAYQLVEIAEVTGDRVAAEQRLVHVRIGSGTRPGRLERTQDRLKPASFRRLAGQRDSPSWMRADPGVGWP